MPSPHVAIVLLALAVACQSPAPATPRPDRVALAKEADDLFNAGALAEAEARYERLLAAETDPVQWVEIQRRLAKIAWEEGQPERAIASLEAALYAVADGDPLRADLSYEIAKIQLRSGDIPSAKARFESIQADFWPAERGRWGVYWARLRLAAIAIHGARPEEAWGLLSPFLNEPAFLEQLRRGHAHDLLYVAAFVSIACRELGEPERAWASDLRFHREPAAPELGLVFQAEEANAAWAAGHPERAEELLADLLSQQTYDLHHTRYELSELPDFLDPELLAQPFAQAQLAWWQAAIAPTERALASSPPRIRLTLARPGDGFQPGIP